MLPTWHALAATALPPVEQQHLFQARQMQALSFAVHVPLVCFGIAFPSMVLLVESLYLRTGDPLYRTLAKRWSKVMIALFAVGVFGLAFGLLAVGVVALAAFIAVGVAELLRPEALE
jgi:cytochrome bd-type quinol oxidase subunit 1